MTAYELSDRQREEFEEKGVLLIPGFYDQDQDIAPIQRAIYEVIGLVAERNGVTLDRKPFAPSHFDDKYLELIAVNRAFGAEVYDAVKQIPSFLRLVSSVRAEALFSTLRRTDMPGIGAASYGIRIDAPHEEHYRSQWHQEFLSQPQSIDGITFWLPLAPVTEAMGPVMFCQGSHRDGLRQVSARGAYANKTGAYKVGIVDEEAIVATYPQVSPLSVPGDLVIIDFLTIHQSGFNVSDRSRWTMQSRLFNFKDPTGIEIGWKASVTAGTDVTTIFKQYFKEETE